MSGFSLPAARRWRWLDDGVLAYALAALRSLWVWPLLYLVTDSLFPGEHDLLAPLTVFGLLAGGTLAAQCGSLPDQGPACCAGSGVGWSGGGGCGPLPGCRA